MSHLYRPLGPRSDYVDRRSGYDKEKWQERLQKSLTVYVGNLTFYTTEDQVYELFSKCGEIDLIVMGLNRKKKSPCGFCFVRFYTHAAANNAVEVLNGVRFDERSIRVDWDSGDGITDENRRFGRGVHGLQWRDEFRKTYDPGRGGEGGGIDYAAFCVNRGRRKRFHPSGGEFHVHPKHHWDRYGYPEQNRRHIRPRYNTNIANTSGVVPPPPPAEETLVVKPDIPQMQPRPHTENMKKDITVTNDQLLEEPTVIDDDNEAITLKPEPENS